MTPVVGLHDAINVGFTRDDNEVTVLVDVKAIKVFQEAQIFKGWVFLVGKLEAFAQSGEELLSNSLRRTGEGEVINLSEQ